MNFQRNTTYSDGPTRTAKVGVSELVKTLHEPTNSDTPPCKGGVEGWYGEGRTVGRPSR